MNNLFIKKFKLSNISLLLQIVLINLVFITIAFVFFGLINFYIISKDLSLEDKKIKLDNLGNDLVQSIVNGAIKTTFYTSKKGEITRSNKLELDPFDSQLIVETFHKYSDSNIKIYNSKLSLLVNSEDFSIKDRTTKIEYSDLNVTSDNSFYEKYKTYFTNQLIKFWHRYNKNRYKNTLVPAFNDNTKVTEVIKNQKKLIFYFADEDQSIIIKIINPLIKENDIYGVAIITESLSDMDKVIGDLSSNLVNNLILTVIIVVLLSIFFARSIIRPINKLSHIAKQYKSRKIKNIKKENFPIRGDEIGQLSQNFKFMSEELFDRISELERFAADVSHELKNPLASIKSANEILKKNYESIDDKVELISIIEKDTNKMNKLITDISNYTKTKVELDKLKNYDVNINKILEDIVESYDSNNKIKSFKTKITKEIYYVFANTEKLARVICNVIDNAISFSPKNSTIFISFSIEQMKGIIKIIDQGPGIGYKYKDKIFERFYTDRADNLDFHSGLGLDIARHIIKSFGGEIYLGKSDVKDYYGACFVIELPVKTII